MSVSQARGWISAAVVGVVLTVACGGATSGSVSLTEESYCQGREKCATDCAGDSGMVTSAFRRSDCGKDYRCKLAIAANPNGYFSCRTDGDCRASSSDDSCLAKSATGMFRPEADTCAKKYASCKSSKEKAWDDDLCSLISAFRDNVVTSLATCFEKPCGEVGECLEASIKAVSLDCD